MSDEEITAKHVKLITPEVEFTISEETATVWDEEPAMSEESVLPVVRQYDDGFEIRAQLGYNKFFVDFQICEENMGGHEVVIAGHVKWDGCMDWDTGDVMYHCCGPEGVDRLAEILKDVWEEAKKIMPNADF